MSTDLQYNWYGIVSGSELTQGDFLDDFPIVVQNLDMPTNLSEIDQSVLATVQVRDVIIMTQACDFQKLSDNDMVTLCPRSNYSDLYGKKRWDSLRKGNVIHAHLLSNCQIEGHEREYQVVDLSRIFSIPYGYVKRFAEAQGERIRLLPPYREHLAQSFARRFMRVGLPIDLPPEFPYK